jgi:hypothetical protein
MRTRASRLSLGLPLLILILGGCRAGEGHSPTVDVIGSYFPAWIVCIIAGIFSTVIVRLLLVGLTVHRYILLKPVVYVGMTAFFTALVWLMFFKN